MITLIDFSYNRSSLSKNVFKNKENTKSKLELKKKHIILNLDFRHYLIVALV